MFKAGALSLDALGEALELYPDACLVIDPGLRILKVNRAAQGFLRLRADAPYPEFARDIVPPESKVRLLDWLRRGGEGTLAVLVRIGSERSHDWVELTQRPALVSDLDVRVLAMRACRGPDLDTPRDVDEYRRLREAAVSRRVGIYEHDHVTDEIYGSGEVRDQFGLKPTEALTIKAFAEATHPDDAAYLVSEIAKSHDPRGDGGFDVRLRIHPKSGGLRWIHTRARTRFKADENGDLKPFLTTGSVIDITHEHLQEEYNRRLAAIMDATPDLVATTDLSGQLTYLNRAGRELMGIQQTTDIHHMHSSELFSAPERKQWLSSAIQHALEHTVFEGEAHLSGNAEDPVPVSVVLLAHKEDRSIGAYLSIIARDQRRQKALEAQLLHSQKLEAIGRLAGGVAHDFNNLLSIIISFASIGLKPKNLPPPTVDSLQEILRAADRAATLTQGLLSFSRKQVLSTAVVDLCRIVRELEPMIAQLLPERIELVVDATGLSLPVRANRSQLEQVVVNLVVNARDAIEEHGTIVIRVASETVVNHATLAAGKYALLSVSDTGTGIEESIQSKVFEPFFTTKPSGMGTGLGLSTVFGIVRQCGGDVELKSGPGRGTTFASLLPQTDEALPLPHEAELTLTPECKKGLVLVVEDQAQLRKALVTVLSSAGYETLAPATPLEALDLAEVHGQAISLVLTDVVMPQMNGIRLAEALGALGIRVPILFMSGYTDEIASHHFPFQEGVNFLSKPVDPAELLSTLGRLSTPAPIGADPAQTPEQVPG